MSRHVHWLRPVRRGTIAAALAALVLPGAAHAAVELSTSGWSWTNPAPQGNTLRHLTFVGATGYAAGDGGTILRTDDAGATWRGLPTGTSASIASLQVVDQNTVVAGVGTGGLSCALRISADGGTSFRLVGIDGAGESCSVGIASVSFVSPTTGFVLLRDGRVLRTTDGGASFGAVAQVDGARQITFTSESAGVALVGTTLRRTADGGQSWSELAALPEGVASMRALSPTTFVAWGADVLATSADAGATWNARNLGGVTPVSVSCRTQLHCALYGGGQLLRTTDGGATFSSSTLGGADLRAVGFADAGRLVAVGASGVTYASSDDGDTFVRTSTEPIANDMTVLLSRGGGGPVGLTDSGRIARYGNSGWALLPTLTATRLIDADFVDAQVGFALAANGTLQRTANGGATWAQLSTGTPSAARFVAAISSETQLLVGGFGVYRSAAGGAFGRVAAKALRKVSPAGVDVDGLRVVLWDARARRAAIRLSGDGGATWRSVALPRDTRRVRSVRLLPGKGLVAVLDDQLQRSGSDRGAWRVLSATASRIGDLEVVSATEYLAVPSDPDWLDAIALRTTDSGATWVPQSLAGGGTRVVALAADGPGRAWASVRDGAEHSLFVSATSGARGTGGSLTLAATKARQRRGKIALAGTLAGAVGGEEIRIAWRRRGATGGWQWATTTAGANGGVFSLRRTLGRGSYDVVAQWTGDSTRSGRGSAVRALTVVK